MADIFCGSCGTRKKPLAYTTYCPNDCDRIVPGDPKREQEREGLGPCPSCLSMKTAEFADCEVGDAHCWDCGDVWWNLTLSGD